MSDSALLEADVIWVELPREHFQQTEWFLACAGLPPVVRRLCSLPEGECEKDAAPGIPLLLYGILQGQVWRAVLRAGLDPGIGILHQAPRSSGGLVYDLIEELRAPLADRVVLGLIGRGWKPQTVNEDGPVLATRDRRIVARVLLGKQSETMRHGRRRVKVGDLPGTQARALRDVLEGKTSRYPAFHFRW